MNNPPPTSEYKKRKIYEYSPCPGCGVSVTRHQLKYSHICGVRGGTEGRLYHEEFRKHRDEWLKKIRIGDTK